MLRDIYIKVSLTWQYTSRVFHYERVSLRSINGKIVDVELVADDESSKYSDVCVDVSVIIATFVSGLIPWL